MVRRVWLHTAPPDRNAADASGFSSTPFSPGGPAWRALLPGASAAPISSGYGVCGFWWWADFLYACVLCRRPFGRRIGTVSSLQDEEKAASGPSSRSIIGEKRHERQGILPRKSRPGRRALPPGNGAAPGRDLPEPSFALPLVQTPGQAGRAQRADPMACNESSRRAPPLAAVIS